MESRWSWSTRTITTPERTLGGAADFVVWLFALPKLTENQQSFFHSHSQWHLLKSVVPVKAFRDCRILTIHLWRDAFNGFPSRGLSHRSHRLWNASDQWLFCPNTKVGAHAPRHNHCGFSTLERLGSSFKLATITTGLNAESPLKSYDLKQRSWLCCPQTGRSCTVVHPFRWQAVEQHSRRHLCNP